MQYLHKTRTDYLLHFYLHMHYKEFVRTLQLQDFYEQEKNRKNKAIESLKNKDKKAK